jgi:hypothetical protein
LSDCPAASALPNWTEPPFARYAKSTRIQIRCQVKTTPQRKPGRCGNPHASGRSTRGKSSSHSRRNSTG